MNNTPFFIFGSKRGGTTLLRLMLNKNSALSIPPESHFFIPLLQRFKPFAQLSKQELEEAKEIIITHPRFIAWNISAETFDKILASLPAPYTLPQLINALFTEQIKDTGKPLWGEKTPQYIDIIPEINTMFPNAVFIALSRDGRDVCMSLKDRGWEGWSVYQRAAYWKRCINNTDFLQQQDVRSIFIKYEDLVIHPKETLTRITDLLGVQFENEMLNFSDGYDKNITAQEIKTGVHTKLKRQPQATDVYKWKTKMSSADIWKFESVCAAELEYAGYEVTRFNKNNVLHQLGKYGYIFAGRVTALVYNIYHSIFSSGLKKKLRKVNVYNQVRGFARKW